MGRCILQFLHTVTRAGNDASLLHKYAQALHLRDASLLHKHCTYGHLAVCKSRLRLVQCHRHEGDIHVCCRFRRKKLALLHARGLIVTSCG